MNLFRPKVQTPDPLPTPPTIDEAATARDRADAIKRRKGRQSTIMVPDVAPAKAPGPATVLGG